MSRINETHRIGKVLVTPEFLTDVMLLPDGDEITDVRWNFEKQCVEFMMISDSFDEIPLSDEIPNYNGEYVSMRNRENTTFDPYFKGWERIKDE